MSIRPVVSLHVRGRAGIEAHTDHVNGPSPQYGAVWLKGDDKRDVGTIFLQDADAARALRDAAAEILRAFEGEPECGQP